MNQHNQQNQYFTIIKKEFTLFLLNQNEEIYNNTKMYIKKNWNENITSFLNKQIPATKAQHLLNIAFDFSKTQEGVDYWKRVSRAWKWRVKNTEIIQKAIQLKR